MFEFHHTRSVIPTLVEHLKKLPPVELSAGNSTGRKRICREDLGQSFRIYKWEDRAEMMAENGLSVVFAETDLQDRLSAHPVNPGKAVQFDEVGVLKNYLLPDGTLRYTYSERMYYQIDSIVDILKTHPETRQAYLSIWDPISDITALEQERVPCSLGYHFLLRNGKLNMLYLMRSLEVTKCLGNDIYTSTRLLEEIAQGVGVEPGFVQFMVGSMHIFE